MFVLQKRNAFRKYVIKRKTFKLRYYWKCFYDKYITFMQWSDVDPRETAVFFLYWGFAGVNYRVFMSSVIRHCVKRCETRKSKRTEILHRPVRPRVWKKSPFRRCYITVKRHRLYCRLVGLGRVYFFGFECLSVENPSTRICGNRISNNTRLYRRLYKLHWVFGKIQSWLFSRFLKHTRQ